MRSERRAQSRVHFRNHILCMIAVGVIAGASAFAVMSGAVGAAEAEMRGTWTMTILFIVSPVMGAGIGWFCKDERSQLASHRRINMVRWIGRREKREFVSGKRGGYE